MEKLPLSNQSKLIAHTLKWSLLAALVGVLAGSASAFFLAALDWATDWRETHRWIIWLLPVAGLAIGLIYHHFGRSIEAGNNLIIDEIHDPKAVTPFRMAPLILFGTVVTHLFGGSAGREGTAIQMGGSLADQLTRPFRLSRDDRRVLLMAGVSAGFGSVFGTPVAGAIFGLEVLSIGRLRYDAIFPCFIAAVVGDQVTRAWGIHHTIYAVSSVPGMSAFTLLSAALAGAIFGVVGMAFANAAHATGAFFKKKITHAPLRPLIGGAIVAAAVWAIGSTRYIGLGIPTMKAAFAESLPPWDFFAKFIFTVLTLGSGFKGGEVTPLFFIGATLGNTLSNALPLPMATLAGMGFVGVFAGAANTPLACTVMAMELFGSPIGVFAGIGCVASYLFSGHAGIYSAQRVGQSKHPSEQ